MTESSEILLANLAALRQVQPGFSLPEQSAAPQVSTGDGGLAVQTPDGRWVQVHSRRDPELEADRLVADALRTGEPEAIVAIGVGLGYVLEAIGRRTSRTRVLAVEPLPACASALLRRRDWSEWIASGRLTLLVAPGYHGASDAWRILDVADGRPPILVAPVLEREFASEITAARQLADRVVFGAQANADARKRLAGRYLLNTLQNLPVVAGEGDVASLFGAFEGVPAILVAAGPSLDRNMCALRDAQDLVVVVAVDTALRPLLNAGIRPHLVVAVDPSDENGRHLTDVPDPSGAWLVAEAGVAPAALQQFRGRTFPFRVAEHAPWPWMRQNGLDAGVLRAWGSVLTSAFDLGVRMGCNPLVFMGADLAHTGGQPYCRNTIFETEWRALTRRGVELRNVWRDRLAARPTCSEPDVAGGQVTTTSVMIAFRDWLVANASAAGRRVFNATDGGVLSGGVIAQLDPADLRETLRGGRRLDVRACLARAHQRTARRAASWQEIARGWLTQIWNGGWDGVAPFTEWTRSCTDVTETQLRGALLRAIQRLIWPSTDEDVLSPLGREAGMAIQAAARQPFGWETSSTEDPRPGDAWHTLAPSCMALDSGACYIYQFRTHAGLEFSRSAAFQDTQLHEDGRVLGPGKCLHDDIRQHGGGRFSAWRGALYFSASDGSDPRANGRRYRIAVPAWLDFLEQLPDSVIRRFDL